MSIMFGNGQVSTAAQSITKTVTFIGSTPPTQWQDANGNQQPITGASYFDANGSAVETTAMTSDATYFATFDYAAVNPGTITISASNFPGTYYVTGDTYARAETTGKDELKYWNSSLVA